MRNKKNLLKFLVI